MATSPSCEDNIQRTDCSLSWVDPSAMLCTALAAPYPSRDPRATLRDQPSPCGLRWNLTPVPSALAPPISGQTSGLIEQIGSRSSSALQHNVLPYGRSYSYPQNGHDPFRTAASRPGLTNRFLGRTEAIWSMGCLHRLATVLDIHPTGEPESHPD